ncbi:hypothetical protein BRADI_3g60456v3 [Brachypodium distachyon]|uniref:Uncharacterized protein n=1 Tax=Brachypodium distachyon TaxID=15368 RepID=A0A2K2D619_BRADI|nr:hypothetical protein BRADI_3g60456v3 [Brachypodium distachyon]
MRPPTSATPAPGPPPTTAVAGTRAKGRASSRRAAPRRPRASAVRARRHLLFLRPTPTPGPVWFMPGPCPGVLMLLDQGSSGRGPWRRPLLPACPPTSLRPCTLPPRLLSLLLLHLPGISRVSSRPSTPSRCRLRRHRRAIGTWTPAPLPT